MYASVPHSVSLAISSRVSVVIRSQDLSFDSGRSSTCSTGSRYIWQLRFASVWQLQSIVRLTLLREILCVDALEHFECW